MELSKRMWSVAALVTPGSRLADIGTDHAYIPIWLVREGRIPSAIAMDVNRGPLLRAKEHIRAEGLEGKIETRLSDGLKNLAPEEADTAVIAGMGGALTIRILEDGANCLASLKELVLQPQSEIPRVRRWIEEHDFQIQNEDMVCEEGKYYPMLRAVHGSAKNRMDEIELLYGPVLLQRKSDCLRQYLEWENTIKKAVLKQLEHANGNEAKGRRQEIECSLLQNRRAMERLGG